MLFPLLLFVAVKLCTVVGARENALDIALVGGGVLAKVGIRVGSVVDDNVEVLLGTVVGVTVGLAVRRTEGGAVGSVVGISEGFADGRTVGNTVGLAVGVLVGL